MGFLKKAFNKVKGAVKRVGGLAKKIMSNPLISTAVSVLPGGVVAKMATRVASSGFVDKAKVVDTLLKHGKSADKQTVDKVSSSIQQSVISETGQQIDFVDYDGDGIDDRYQTNKFKKSTLNSDFDNNQPQTNSSSFMEKLKQFWTKYKTPIIILTVVGVVIAVGVWMYKRNKRR